MRRHRYLYALGIALIAVLALSRIDAVRYSYHSERYGPRTLTIKVDRFTGQTYFLVIGENTGWRRAGNTP